MKTERRHELQTNMLADKMAAWIEAAEPYSRAILAGIVAIVVIAFAVVYISAQHNEQVAKAWDQVLDALGKQDVGQLNETAAQYPRTAVADWARLMAADLALARGSAQVFQDKKDAQDEIRRAADLYEELKNSTDFDEVQEKAIYGLARAEESLGELQKAKPLYKAVADRGGTYAAVAQQRWDDLQRTEVKEFYDWYAKYEPPRPSEQPDKRPDFLNDNLDNTSPLQLPKSITERLPTTVTPPAAGESPVGDEPVPTVVPKKSAEEKPAAETPATSAEKPAAEKDAAPPAAEKPAADSGDARPPLAEKPAEKPASEKSAAEPEKAAPPAKP